MAKKLRLSGLLPELTPNKKYLKKMKFLAKRKHTAKAVERQGCRKKDVAKKSGKVTRTQKTGVSAREAKKKLIKSGAKKSSVVSVKEKKISKTKPKKETKDGISKEDGTVVQESEALQKAQRRKGKKVSLEDAEKLMIERAICGEEEVHDMLLPAAAGGSGGLWAETLPQYDCLPFLEDYAEQKRSEIVSAETLLHKAHVFFKDLGKKESAMRRVAARRLRELKDINRRGGDKDGFRYVVPRNVKEVVQQMMQNTPGTDVAAVESAKLTSTFNDENENNISERPAHRRKRKNSCFSDFYQFQVSKRWTRNAENFLNKGRAYKSMFDASKPQRSIKKL